MAGAFCQNHPGTAGLMVTHHHRGPGASLTAIQTDYRNHRTLRWFFGRGHSLFFSPWIAPPHFHCFVGNIGGQHAPVIQGHSRAQAKRRCLAVAVGEDMDHGHRLTSPHRLQPGLDSAIPPMKAGSITDQQRDYMPVSDGLQATLPLNRDVKVF